MSDMISREAAIDAIGEVHPLDYNGQAILERIKALPSAEKVGKWMETDAAPHRIYCSECYATFIPNKEWVAWKEGIIPRHYCPSCGARMRGEENESS